MKKLAYGTVLVFAFGIGCGTIIGNPEEDKKTGSGKKAELAPLPDATAIDLGVLGAGAGLRLDRIGLTDDRCAATASLGIFGIALGSACAVSPLPERALYGENPDRDGDGKLTCDDYESSDGERGLLFPFLCEPGVVDAGDLVSFRFGEGGKDHALSFAPTDGAADFVVAPPHGSWNARGDDALRYPALLRAWTGTAGGPLTGVFAMSLVSAAEGRLALELPLPDDAPLRGDIAFASRSTVDAAACAASPSKDTCHWQDVRLKGSETAEAKVGVPPGYRIVIFADAKVAPRFLALEGKIRYTAAVAEAAHDPESPAVLRNLRELYFRVVQKDGQIWGAFDLKDERGVTLDLPVTADGATVNVTHVLRDGVCQSFGSDAWVPCTAIDPAAYAKLWIGDAALTGVPADYATPLTFGEAPPR